jgi:isocitrate dehydrogenase
VEVRHGGGERVRRFLIDEMKADVREQSGIGIKPISPFGSKRLVAAAIRYALQRRRRSVTLVHKGNIMKYTEGAFRDWGYEVAREQFGDSTVAESDAGSGEAGSSSRTASPIRCSSRSCCDRTSTTCSQRRTSTAIICLTPQPPRLAVSAWHPAPMSATRSRCSKRPMAPRRSMRTRDMINPGSLILSGVMMLEHLGWNEAADLVVKGLKGAIANRTVTYDLERQMEGATKVSTSRFAEEIARNM